MTLITERINTLIARREEATNRRDEQIDWALVDLIDTQLRDVPPGQNNDVDKLLGRTCAVLDKRNDYGITAAQAEQYRALSDGLPDGIVDHDDVLEGMWK